MADKNRAPQNDFSLDEILAEAQTLKDTQNEQGTAPDIGSTDAASESGAKPPVFSSPEDIAESAQKALKLEPAGSETAAVRKEKKRRSFFGRKKRGIPEFEEEEDIYYGLQLKSLQEYREDYEKTIRIDSKKIREAENSSPFSYLFQQSDDSGDSSRQDAQREELHRARRERIERTLREAGLESDDIYAIADSAAAAPEVSAEPSVPDSPVGTIPETPGPATIPQPQPMPVPVPLPGPAPVPAPTPEVIPEPQRRQEVPPPMTEPVFQPEPQQPAAPTPVIGPQIRCENDEEKKPVREPETPPQVKEGVLAPPPVREPPMGRPPYSAKISQPFLTGYRPCAGKPVHMIDLNDFHSILKQEAKLYPLELPKPEPIPLPEKPAAPSEDDEQPLPVDTEAAAEETFTEEAESAFPEEPIPFPVAPPTADEFSPVEDGSASPLKLKKKKQFHVFGSEEEDNESQEELQPEPPELDDYSSPSDAPSIANDLIGNLHRLYLRGAVTAICTLLLFFFGLFGEYSGILPQALQITLEMQTYLILNLIFLSIAVLMNYEPLLNGFKGLFTFQANSDSAVAVAVTAATIQSAVLFSAQNTVSSGKLHLYSTLTVLALLLNALGKASMMRRICKNFRFVSSPEQKQAVQLFDDYNTALQMGKDVLIDSPAIAYQSKTDFLKHFLRFSYIPDPSEQTSQIMAPLVFLSSLILGIVTFVLTKDVYSALTAFAAAACVGTPFMNMLSVNLPLNRLSKIASRCGAMIVGYRAVEEFGSTNAVMLDAKDLFPKGTVVLNGIKTFAGQRIDEAIVDASALMCAVGGPLSDLFDQIIQSRRDILPKIDNILYEDDKGVTGWVSGRRILIGNRSLLETHGIEPPSRDYEEKYIQGGKEVVYLATGGDLIALFIVSYNSDRRRAMELRRMEDNGISLIVRTQDPNITPRLLAECFGLDEQCIRVLPERLGEVYAELTAQPQERSPALLATKGRSTAMMRMLTACVRQRSNISLAVALQSIAVILGMLLVIFLTCYSGLKQLTTAALFLYELFWAAAVWFVPRLRKP